MLEMEVSQSSATMPLLIMSLASIFSTTRAVERSSTRLFSMTRENATHKVESLAHPATYHLAAVARNSKGK